MQLADLAQVADAAAVVGVLDSLDSVDDVHRVFGIEAVLDDGAYTRQSGNIDGRTDDIVGEIRVLPCANVEANAGAVGGCVADNGSPNTVFHGERNLYRVEAGGIDELGGAVEGVGVEIGVA